MKPEIIVVTCLFFSFAILEIIFTRFFNKPGQTREDALVEIIGGSALLFVSQPFALFMGGLTAAFLVPQYEGVLTTWHPLAILGLFLIFDDMMQYWWHRLSHTLPWLYNLHRAHHNAPYLSVRVVYRNNMFYYLLMPSLWFSGALIFMGGGWVYAGYLVFKMLVILGAHSDVRWDAPLYKIKALSPVMWVLERTISHPQRTVRTMASTRKMALLITKVIMATYYSFGMCCLVLRKLRARYPTEFGVENLPYSPAQEQLLWPIFKAKS